MTLFECPTCGHQNDPKRRTCSQCQTLLEGAPSTRDTRRRGYLREAAAILGGGLSGALLAAAVWTFMLYEPVFTLVGGPKFYFNDFLIFAGFPLSIVLAATAGIFCGGAAASYLLRRRKGVSWGAAAVAALAFLLPLLAFMAVFAVRALKGNYSDFPLYPILAVLLLAPPTAVLIYLARARNLKPASRKSQPHPLN